MNFAKYQEIMRNQYPDGAHAGSKILSGGSTSPTDKGLSNINGSILSHRGGSLEKPPPAIPTPTNYSQPLPKYQTGLVGG